MIDHKTYSDECDRLSTLEVQECFTSWGRWFIEDGMLSTWVVAPQTKFLAVRKLFVYGYAIEKLRSDEDQVEFLRQISEKTWLGEKGLRQLKRTLKYFKRGVKNFDNENDEA